MSVFSRGLLDEQRLQSGSTPIKRWLLVFTLSWALGLKLESRFVSDCSRKSACSFGGSELQKLCFKRFFYDAEPRA